MNTWQYPAIWRQYCKNTHVGNTTSNFSSRHSTELAQASKPGNYRFSLIRHYSNTHVGIADNWKTSRKLQSQTLKRLIVRNCRCYCTSTQRTMQGNVTWYVVERFDPSARNSQVRTRDPTSSTVRRKKGSCQGRTAPRRERRYRRISRACLRSSATRRY